MTTGWNEVAWNEVVMERSDRNSVQRTPDFKPMNVGLRKRLSFSAIRTKHKPSLDMLACVSKQLPYRYRRGNSTQRRHLDEITKNKQARKV